MFQYLKALELTEDASWEEVRTAYKDLVRVWHPDRFQGDVELQARAERKTKEINLAYQELKVKYKDRGAWQGTTGNIKTESTEKVKPEAQKKSTRNEWERAEKRRAERKGRKTRKSFFQNGFKPYQSPPRGVVGETLGTLRLMCSATLQALILLVSPGFLLSIWIFVVVIARPSPERVSSFVKAQTTYMSERIVNTIRVFSQGKGGGL